MSLFGRLFPSPDSQPRLSVGSGEPFEGLPLLPIVVEESVGAPLSLLARVHEAALDEVRYTEQCCALDGVDVDLGCWRGDGRV